MQYGGDKKCGDESRRSRGGDAITTSRSIWRRQSRGGRAMVEVSTGRLVHITLAFVIKGRTAPDTAQGSCNMVSKPWDTNGAHASPASLVTVSAASQ